MEAKTIQIVDYGRGAQLEGHRLTVMDVFYYLHRGRDFEFIHHALPTLTREQFDAVVEYVKEHHDELVAEDCEVEQRIKQGIAEQKTRGFHREIDKSVPVEERAARLREKVRKQLKEQAERNGGNTAR